MLVVDTERQPPQVLDKAAACILTDRCLGRRATSQRCTSCGGWFVQDQLEFTFRCALVTAVDAGQDHQPAVTCELQTRYPTFTCPACKYSSRTKIEPRSTAAELAKAEEAAGDAASFSSATKDEEQNHCSDQLSPDHVAAVYSLCSSNGQDNLASLNKSFIVICPDCGQRSSQLHEPCQVLDYVRNHVNSNPGTNDAAPARSCQTLLGCFGKGIYHTPASYGSISMSASPVEDVICHWVARLLVTIALHIARSTCTASNTQFASSTTTASASAASASSSSKSFHAYLPWRNWALETLREDVTVIDAANWVRPSLAGLLLPDRHSLLDLILAPPFIAAGGQQAGMTAHKLAVLMKRKLKELQQQQQLSLATVEGIRGVLEDMLSNDAVFKHYAADQRVGEFLAIAGISNIGELAPLMTLPYVQDQHVKVCPCCGTSVSTVSTVPLVGCSYCIMCLRCPSCQAEHEMTTTGNLAAAGLLTNSAALAEAAAAAAAADFLCPWCEDHDDTAALHWYQGCLTDGEFDELKLTTATAAQKEYLTQHMKVVNPWRIEQCLPNGFIVVLTVGYSKVKRKWRYYIAPDGRSIRSKPEVEAWLEQQHWQQQQQQQQCMFYPHEPCVGSLRVITLKG